MAALESWPRCRFARADITPEHPLPLAGYVDRKGPHEGVAGALEANILLTALDRVPCLFVTLDSLFASEAFRTCLLERLRPMLPGLTRSGVQLIASHTHYAPALDPDKPRLGVADGPYLSCCADRLVAAVEGALSTPATVVQACRFGQAPCTANVYRRRLTWVREARSMRFRRRVASAPDPTVAIDHRLRLARLVGADAETLGVVWSWPCHAVSLGETLEVSPDFPGAVRDALRDRYGAGLPVFYLPGFSGDIRPRSRPRTRTPREVLAMPFARAFEKPDAASHARLCESVSAAALAADDQAASATPRDVGDAVAFAEHVELPLGVLLEGYSGERALERSLIALPPLRFLLVGAEVCSGYSDVAREVDFATGCANTVHGYLPTAAQVAVGGYEVEGFMRQFSLQGRFRPDIDVPVREFIGAAGAIREPVEVPGALDRRPMR